MKRLTGQVEAFGIISDNATPYGYRGAHRLIPCGALVAMVVRSAGLRGAERDREDRLRYLVFGVDGCPRTITADDS